MIKLLITTILSLACACVISCAFWSKYGSPANIETATYELSYRVVSKLPADKQATVRRQAYAAAVAIRQFEATRVPTGAQLEQTILLYTDKGSTWSEIAHDVATIWDLARPNFGSGVAEAFGYLEAVARGIERMAMPGPYGTPEPGPR